MNREKFPKLSVYLLVDIVLIYCFHLFLLNSFFLFSYFSDVGILIGMEEIQLEEMLANYLIVDVPSHIFA